mmetsp:Transcript_41576/g.74593  ORF Transcript_41576/g.74593 Transcript_41576/m.74593 type:complete len:219 (-) Transcript_41576:53-709(-)
MCPSVRNDCVAASTSAERLRPTLWRTAGSTSRRSVSTTSRQPSAAATIPATGHDPQPSSTTFRGQSCDRFPRRCSSSRTSHSARTSSPAHSAPPVLRGPKISCCSKRNERGMLPRFTVMMLWKVGCMHAARMWAELAPPESSLLSSSSSTVSVSRDREGHQNWSCMCFRRRLITPPHALHSPSCASSPAHTAGSSGIQPDTPCGLHTVSEAVPGGWGL